MSSLSSGLPQSITAAVNSAGSVARTALAELKSNEQLRDFQLRGMEKVKEISQTGAQSIQRAWNYLSGPNSATHRVNLDRFVRPEAFVQRFQEMQRNLKCQNGGCARRGRGFSFFGGSFFGGGMPGFSRFPGSGSSSSPGGAGPSFPGAGIGGDMLNKMLEWCSVSHAHKIADNMGIKMNDIKFDVQGRKVTVTIDAPEATPLQIEALGKKVEEECPMARFYGKKHKEMVWQKALAE